MPPSSVEASTESVTVLPCSTTVETRLDEMTGAVAAAYTVTVAVLVVAVAEAPSLVAVTTQW